MLTATGKYPLVVSNGTGKRTLFVPEQFRFNKGFRKLREIDLNKITGETFYKTPLLFIKGNESGPADGFSRSPLAGSGFANQKG